MESFGARLKREREKKNISLDDISLSTKIGTRLLRALEEEHFDQLPGGIFNKGFVRAYARCLGMDEDQAVADYLIASGEASPMKAPEPPILAVPEEKPQSSASGVEQIPWGVLAGALLVIAFGFAIWGFSNREKQREAREQSIAHSQTVAPETAASASTPTPSAPAPAEAPAATPSTTPVNSGEFTVLIKARDDSWLSITADDKPAVEETLAAGTEKSVPAKQAIAIRAGNAGALDFYFNGKKLPSQGDEGQVKTLTFNENGLEPPKPPTTETTQQPQ
ncbi:MAG TPA: RodZ domain-containing protein [Terriglobales bacterium]|nr:RodZ domain-containing protein [Terriglobales bacterium]